MRQQEINFHFPDELEKMWKKRAIENHWPIERYAAAWHRITWEEWQELPKYDRDYLLAEYRVARYTAEHRRTILKRKGVVMDRPHAVPTEVLEDGWKRRDNARRKAFSELVKRYEREL